MTRDDAFDRRREDGADTAGERVGGTGSLGHRLREAPRQELLRLLRERAAEVAAPEALQALANPFLDREGVELLGARRDLLTAYEVRKALAFHPQAPEVLARRMLAGLYRRDLLAAGADVRLQPRLRRAADQLLAERLPGTSLGEKVAMARSAGLGLMQRLRDDPNPRVMAALLDNPRLTEGALMPLLTRDSAPPQVLEVVAADRRWGVRYPIRAALARNPSTPVQVALRILPLLKKLDQRAVCADLRIAAPVRKRAQLLLGGR